MRTYGVVVVIGRKPNRSRIGRLSSDASTYTRPWDMLSALSVFMVVPVLLIVLVGQRMIIAGLSRGAVK